MKIVNPEDVCGIGNGVVNPLAAVEPGLLYDITFSDYIGYLKTFDISWELLIPFDNPTDVKEIQKIKPYNLNVPSFFKLLSEDQDVCDFKRKVKHVGVESASTYRARLGDVDGIEISVYPTELSFIGAQEMTFKLTVRIIDWSKNKANSFHTYLEWYNAKYNVRSSILIAKKD
ncbi:unnamed protein product [Cuscuta epithymum]|uniref:Subtilisin-like protease fibronectin type-III domain-containing protein n=1 Tax=Cuscuta epithymum TaxID=186058 RepID=A0AAV0DV72_9ASTE|nr:unnamed protein product [Cuscuta epithymum]